MALLFSLEGSKELTLKFSGPAAGLFGGSPPFLGVDSIEGHNRVSGKGFPTTGPRVQAENVAIHRGLHCALRICAPFGSTRLICASFGSTRLICASFGSTRLICASFGSTRLICASFGSTRLICASFGSTRLLCRVGVQRGADRREAGRMREGHMDASGEDIVCIGVILHDSHGTAEVKSVTGNKILRILKAHGLALEIPEDLYHLIKKAVSIRKHLERNRKDKDSKFRLILVDS
ncbi:40S ribosomal protein S13-like [Cucumis melo var. makuwa]|uniref:40S ribosomal protein S13-like n=1 Tax=Cucumis melo var. makuwa TaxID=1194695 RepID=A0A5A7TF25_CUCMM|nr:40S ribosomal protein S13-like [Cucumis melo var. makuwa]